VCIDTTKASPLPTHVQRLYAVAAYYRTKIGAYELVSFQPSSWDASGLIADRRSFDGAKVQFLDPM